MSKPRTLNDQDSTARTAIPPMLRIVPIAYRVDDAALALGVSQSTVWALIREGKIEARRLGRATVIRRRDLHAYVNGLPTTKAAQRSMRMRRFSRASPRRYARSISSPTR